MKILVIGSGGREHALIWKIKQSPKVKEIFCAPGNGGIGEDALCVDIAADDIAGLLHFAKEKRIDLTIVGPEAPLVAGIVDEFRKEGLKIFGPSQAAAKLEGSKAFAKEFMHRHGIPTAEFQVFTEPRKARHVFRVVPESDYPLVIKADGLAAGKGVVICKNFSQLDAALSDMMEKKIFKEAGSSVVVEDGLSGEEVSIIAISDGRDFVLLAPSQDHKRIFDNDEGPNTGGMGAYSPVPGVGNELLERISEKIIRPTIEGMAREGAVFVGVLYAGLMLTEDGPKVLEYNVRFGDPETQVILPRLKDDLLELMLAAIDGKLKGRTLQVSDQSAVCVVLAAGGYPGPYENGKEISGLAEAGRLPQTKVFHAGTRRSDGKMLTAGGRVLGVTAWGGTLADAVKRSYAAVGKISFEKGQYRRDIGAKALKKTGAANR